MSSFESLNALWDRFEADLVSKFDANQRKLWDVFIFLLRFLILAIPLHVLLWINFDAYTLQVITARSVSFLLSLAGVVHVVSSTFIKIQTGITLWTIEIIKDCVGWKSFMAVTGLIFAVRKVSLDKRIVGVMIAAPIIYIGNSFRIFSSIYLSLLFGVEWFEFIHGVLWQWGLIALVIAIWWIWLVKIADVGKMTHKRKSHKKS